MSLSIKIEVSNPTLLSCRTHARRHNVHLVTYSDAGGVSGDPYISQGASKLCGPRL